MSEDLKPGYTVQALANQAELRALVTGITHYVLQSGGEAWIAGQGAKDALWPDLVPLYTLDSYGPNRG